MQVCPGCAKEISRAAATECPHCGSRLGQAPPSSDDKPVTSRLAIAGALLCPLFFLLNFLAPAMTRYADSSLVWGAIMTALVGLVLCFVASTKIKKSEGRLRGGKFVRLGAFFNIIVLFFLALMIGGRCPGESGRRAACVNNLKQLGLILNMYASENGDKYPPLDDTKNNFMFESDVLYPEYLSDAAIVTCPSDPEYNPKTNFRLISTEHQPTSSVGEVHPDCITDMSYVYLG